MFQGVEPGYRTMAAIVITTVVMSACFSVCSRANGDQTQPSFPADPDQIVMFIKGPVRLAVRLRYLDPFYWRNPPREKVDPTGETLMRLGWPGLEDATSEVVRRCDKRVVCRDVIIVSVDYPRVSMLNGFGVLTCCATDGSSLLRSLPHVGGADLFLEKYGPAINVYVKGTAKDGNVVYGFCQWGDAPASSAQLRSQNYVRDRIADAGQCSLVAIPVGGELSVSIGFNGSQLSDWKKIEAGVVDLIAGFQSHPQSP
jgi:hypothetical protein